MIPEVLLAFVPILGATAATMAVWMLPHLLREWDERRAKEVISELETLASLGQVSMAGVEKAKLPKDAYYQFLAKAGKYRNWPIKFKDPYFGAKINNVIDRSLYYAEVFRTYGYLRGRFHVFRDKWRSWRSAKTRKVKG